MTSPAAPDRSVGLVGATVRAALVRAAPACRVGWRARIWDALWRRCVLRWHGSVRSRLHGVGVRLPYAYPYEMFSARYPTYNAPLVAAARLAASRAGGRSIAVVDVGAAVGDTALLVRAGAPDASGPILCIEPDPEFSALLSSNLARVPDITVSTALLSRASGRSRSLVRTHAGTASAQGSETSVAATLDEVVSSWGRQVDVLKCDVDGSDGAVLAGAHATLARDRPIVVVEWHPLLVEATGNPLDEARVALVDAGYSLAARFDKTGVFAGWRELSDIGSFAADALSAARVPELDEHWDLVAFPSTFDGPDELLALLPNR